MNDDFKENLNSKLQKVKKFTIGMLKKPLRKFLLITLLVVLGVIFLAASYFTVGDGFSKKSGKHMKENPVKYDVVDGSILIEEEQIKMMEKLLENIGVDKETLHLTTENLQKIYAAEVITQEINRGVAEEEGKYYGRVYVKKATDSTKQEDLKDLTYIDFESFEALGADEILNYFSVDNDLLCIANTKTVTDPEGNTSQFVNIQKIPYKNQLLPYMMPVEFLLELAFITDNPEFVMALADKVIKETKIIIAVLEETTTTETETTNKFKIETKTQDKKEYYDSDGSYLTTVNLEPRTSTSREKKEVETQTETKIDPIIKIAYVKSWFIEQIYTYNKVTTTNVNVIGEDDPSNLLDDEPMPPLGSYEFVSSETMIDDIQIDTYRAEASRKIDRKRSIKITTTRTTYEEGVTQAPKDNAEEFLEMLKTKYKKTGTFMKEAPIGNIVNGAGILLQMLQNNERTQAIEHIMRYILYVHTGKSYGVTELDLNLFDVNHFSPITGLPNLPIEDKFWYALKALNYSDEAIAGAMGNIRCESGFRTTSVNASSGAYGLAQWLGGRRQKLQTYAASKERTEEDADIQIEFLIAEITGQGDAAEFADRRTSGGLGQNYYTSNQWKNATTVEEAAVAYCWFYETPSLDSTKTDEVLEEEAKRKQAAKEYYEKYKGKGLGGYIEPSDGSYGVKTYYTASNGRRYTVLHQGSINNWSDKCNRAASAIIASGHANQTSNQLIDKVNAANRSIFTVIPDNNYWNQYGLTVTSYEEKSDYIPKVRQQLTSKGYALLWLNNGGTYYGKSGTKWTELYHWIAVIDYKYENNTEKICIADYRGITWVDIDEFKANGVARAVYISEK